MMPHRLVIPDNVRLYLRVQHGYVSHLQNDRDFDDAYRMSVLSQYHNILPWLPQSAYNTVDVGGGMSGIHILIQKVKRNHQHVVVDGYADDPVVNLHRRTFSNANVLGDFYSQNGVTPPRTQSPTERWTWHEKTDLLTSFAAWGFHIPPHEYIAEVLPRLHAGSTVIIDVRKNKPDWFNQFDEAFKSDHTVIHELAKLKRCVWLIP